MVYSPDKHTAIYGIDGSVIELRGCSIDNVAWLYRSLILLQENIDRNLNITFAQLCTKPIFKGLATQILAVCGIDINLIDVNTLYCLLRPYQAKDENGDQIIKPPLLYEVALGGIMVDKLPGMGSGDQTALDDLYAAAVVNLQICGAAPDMQSAIELAESMPASDLLGILMQRINALKPPKQKEMEDLAKMLEKNPQLDILGGQIDIMSAQDLYVHPKAQD